VDGYRPLPGKRNAMPKMADCIEFDELVIKQILKWECIILF